MTSAALVDDEYKLLQKGAKPALFNLKDTRRKQTTYGTGKLLWRGAWRTNCPGGRTPLRKTCRLTSPGRSPLYPLQNAVLLQPANSWDFGTFDSEAST